jgi:hypothetical protein
MSDDKAPVDRIIAPAWRVAYVWDAAKLEEFLSDIASGSAICAIAGTNGYPSEKTIYRMMSSDKEFREKIQAARVDQQEYEMENIVAMADKATPEDWQVVKLQIWARQWRASKLAPKKYGDKIDHAHSGAVTMQLGKDESNL